MHCIRANIDITIIEGGTFDQVYKWKTGASPQTAVNLSGFTAKMTVRARNSDAAAPASPAWSADAASGIYFYQDADLEWCYRLYIKDEDTVNLCVAHKDVAGVYDLFLLNSGGEAVLQHHGVATLVAAVTR